MVIQTRIFRRLIGPGVNAKNVDEAIDAVVAEVNEFIAPMGSKVVGVRYELAKVGAEGHSLYSSTVIYIE